jgi:hypothetical protein
VIFAVYDLELVARFIGLLDDAADLDDEVGV